MFQPITIDTKALDNVLQTIAKKLGKDYPAFTLRVARRAGLRLEERVSEYPPKQTGVPLPATYTRTSMAKKAYKRPDGHVVRPGDQFQSKFKSQKAQGGFFVRVYRGDISIPYKRTGTLGKSITSTVERRGDDVIIRIGSNLDYAQPVIGSPQAPYFKDYWTPLQDNVENAIDDVREGIFNDVFEYLGI